MHNLEILLGGQSNVKFLFLEQNAKVFGKFIEKKKNDDTIFMGNDFQVKVWLELKLV